MAPATSGLLRMGPWVDGTTAASLPPQYMELVML